MPARHTLIVVDVQKGFVTAHSRHVVKPIERLQARFDHVVLTKFENPDPSPFRRILGYRKLSPGSRGTELALKPRGEARIITRPHYTCVTPALEGYLKRHRLREVHVCGIATEACVFKTALDLFERNIRCRVLADLCASDQRAHYHRVALELLTKLIGADNIITSADLSF